MRQIPTLSARQEGCDYEKSQIRKKKENTVHGTSL
jgi:hypothetical protein